MELYFLRHAIAQDHGPKYPDDAKRPLTKEGGQKMYAAAQGMLKQELSFDIILSSPYVRARQTAEIVAEVFKLDKKSIRFTDNLVPGGTPKLLTQEIRGLAQHCHSRDSGSSCRTLAEARNPEKILCVGHEPHLSSFISFLLTGGAYFPINFKKAGLCHLTWYPGDKNATLEWLLTPAQLRLIK